MHQVGGVQSQLFWAGLVLFVTSCQTDADNEPLVDDAF